MCVTSHIYLTLQVSAAVGVDLANKALHLARDMYLQKRLSAYLNLFRCCSCAEIFSWQSGHGHLTLDNLGCGQSVCNKSELPLF